MPTPRIRIVHISDLHLGKESTQPWRMRRVLGRAWVDNLKAIADDGPVDLLCFTGDVAQSGKADQYAEAQEFVHTALEILCLPPKRFFCVPGNHDVDRSINKPEWESLRNAIGKAGRGAAEGVSKWMAGGAVPFGFQAEWREAVLARQAAYQAWLGQIGRSALLPGPGLLGWRVSLDLGHSAPLHLIGLDSAWLAGDDHDATKLLFTADQIGGLCADEQGDPLQGPLIALMHHPVDELADGREARRLLAEHGVSLILHGHLHEPEHARWDTPSQGLHLSAAGCLYESTKFPNSLQVLDLAMEPPHTLQPQQLWARAWSARGHWHDDDSLYPGSKNGRLLLSAPPAPTLPLANDLFVGREEQLKALKAALLPANGQETQAVVVCCAIEGMAGVGKTRLAEEFVTQHWLPHWGLTVGEDMAHHVVRLTLSAEAAAPTTQDLAQTVADRLRLVSPQDTLYARVAEGLRHGPQGKPRLLWLDNIDTPALAQAVAPLAQHLKGCPLLVTARFQRLGSSAWQRVPVKPMEDEDALKLLQSQLDPERGLLPREDALTLVHRLGGLPLALHIAASHLNLGHTAKSFLKALTDAGLGLPPAQADDPALLADHARAVIRHSFALSWQHWCDRQPALWQQALVALAHGPAADVGASLAAALSGLPDDDWAQLAPQAQRLSLLQVEPQTRRVSLHPLIAEFLRSQAGGDASQVQTRLGEWFMPRLPERDDGSQASAWGEVWAEPGALGAWLQGLPLEQGLQVERAGKKLAVRQGPFGLWQAFLQRLVSQAPEAKHLSNLYFTLGQVAHHAGDPDLALSCAERKADIDHQRGDEREHALALGVTADILQARGQLDEALRIRQEEQLPVYQQLGDVRSVAVTKGKIADILQARGQLDEALRIRQEEELPVYQQLGDVRSLAVTKGQIADILQARGQLDEALRIRQEEELPVYQQLGDVRLLAVTKGQIADILQARGQLDEALRIRQEEELPVYDQLGDVRSLAITKGKIAYILQAQGQWDEALRIRQEEVLPVYQQLGDMRELLVCQANVALALEQRGHREDRPEIARLLQEAHAPAQRMGLPEAGQIEAIFQRIFGRPLPPVA